MSVRALLSRLKETEERFEQRAVPRESATRGIERGDYVGANADETLRARLAHLGVSPEMTERVGTRSFRMPEQTPAAGTRGIIDNLTFERILGANDLIPVSFLALGQRKARSVGRIHIRDASGRRLGFGTGFLVSPRLLLTNNHVLEDERLAANSEVEFDFEVDLGGTVRRTVTFPLSPKSFFLTNLQLDFTLVGVAANSGGEPGAWGWIQLLEKDGLLVKGECVSIVQHPNGEAKQLALRENRVIDLLEDFAHYQTDTAPGSSGSPVFNDQWELVALHHSGVPERFEDGAIKSVDGRRWEEWMGDHRIKWIANEGVSGKRITDFIKSVSGLDDAQRRLRDGLFSSLPPMPDAGMPVQRLNPEGLVQVPTVSQATVPPPAVSGVSATWTLPLQISVSIGLAPGVAGVPTGSAPFVGSKPGGSEAEEVELQEALAEAARARGRTYYDADQDRQNLEGYYASIDADHLPAGELFDRLSELLKSTHTERPAYRPSIHLYPWIDLHEDLKLRSIYSGKFFEPEELIREDFRIGQERARFLQELARQESVLTPGRLQEELDLLEAQNPFNCEHVVPQSWFAKKEPMRGDLHHLFACESGCNSFRGNIPYFDFPDFEEAVRTACGKRVENKFEPGAGKGAVARATLYFLMRYPGKVDSSDEFPEERLRTLLKWHEEHSITTYERHRNQAIFQKQGNRNPLVDHPEWAEKIDFARGLS